jgi:hypothetical protein
MPLAIGEDQRANESRHDKLCAVPGHKSMGPQADLDFPNFSFFSRMGMAWRKFSLPTEKFPFAGPLPGARPRELLHCTP